MIRRQRTEDGRQMVVCRCAARFKRLRGKAAIKSQSSALSPERSGRSFSYGNRTAYPLRVQSSERGFSLISAIFLLVVIAALGTFAVTLSTTQQQSAALDVLGSRAYQAARAGVEWGAYQVLVNSACPPSQALTGLPNTLSGFTVNVNCTSFPSYNEAGNTVNMYQLSSTASQGTPGTPNYVERNLTVTIAK